MKSDVACCSLLKQMMEEWELGLQLKPWQVVSVEVARILQLIFIWLSTASLSDQILHVSVGAVPWLVSNVETRLPESSAELGQFFQIGVEEKLYDQVDKGYKASLQCHQLSMRKTS